ncbi:MAG: 3-keto-5-aminohexanoate cleavage protein [Acidobacteriaceae bacterium]
MRQLYRDLPEGRRHPDTPYPQSAVEIAEEAALCRQNGATVLHTHAEGKWAETMRAVRGKSDIIVQCGMSSLPIPERMEAYREHADMLSVILNHHDEAFARSECLVLHSRDELEEYAALCREYRVAAEFEIWHAGSIWNLNYLIERKLIQAPYICTLFFGWPGGTWSPPTIEEYHYRRRLMPEGCVCSVSIMGPEQIDIITAAILNGDHVRVGTEDYPFDRLGKLASCHRLVKEAAEIALAVGRPIATIDQAREMLGLQVK